MFRVWIKMNCQKQTTILETELMHPVLAFVRNHPWAQTRPTQKRRLYKK